MLFVWQRRFGQSGSDLGFREPFELPSQRRRTLSTSPGEVLLLLRILNQVEVLRIVELGFVNELPGLGAQ